MGTDSSSRKEVLVNNSRVIQTAAPTGAPPPDFIPLALKAVGFAAGAGADFARRAWSAASETRPDATAEEVAALIERLWRSVAASKSVDNPLGLILTKIGSEVAGQLDRVRAEAEEQQNAQRRQNAEMVRMWTDILDNPAESELHNQAREALRELEIER
jgi:hypothetical protein